MATSKKTKNILGEFGFTLAETVIVVAITGALMMSVTLLFKDLFVDSRQEGAAVGNIGQARLFATNFVNEVRNAAPGVDGSFPITVAGTNALTIFTTYHAGGTVNRISYTTSGGTVYKTVTAPSGSPLAYGTGTTFAILPASAFPSLSFAYYDGSYNGVSGSALSSPVNLNSVKFIQMTLTGLKQDATGSSDTFTVSEGSTLRNVKTNLGN